MNKDFSLILGTKLAVILLPLQDSAAVLTPCQLPLITSEATYDCPSITPELTRATKMRKRGKCDHFIEQCVCVQMYLFVRLGTLDKALGRTSKKPIQTSRPSEQTAGKRWTVNNHLLQNFKVILNSCSLVTDSSPPPPFHFSCHSMNSM